MLDQNDLQAISELLRPLSERLDKLDRDISDAKAVAIKTAVIVENEVATNISLLQEDHINVMHKLKQLETLPQTVDEIQSDISVIKEVVASHSLDIKELKVQ